MKQRIILHETYVRFLTCTRKVPIYDNNNSVVHDIRSVFDSYIDAPVITRSRSLGITTAIVQ